MPPFLTGSITEHTACHTSSLANEWAISQINRSHINKRKPHYQEPELKELLFLSNQSLQMRSDWINIILILNYCLRVSAIQNKGTPTSLTCIYAQRQIWTCTLAYSWFHPCSLLTLVFLSWETLSDQKHAFPETEKNNIWSTKT